SWIVRHQPRDGTAVRPDTSFCTRRSSNPKSFITPQPSPLWAPAQFPAGSITPPGTRSLLATKRLADLVGARLVVNLDSTFYSQREQRIAIQRIQFVAFHNGFRLIGIFNRLRRNASIGLFDLGVHFMDRSSVGCSGECTVSSHIARRIGTKADS